MWFTTRPILTNSNWKPPKLPSSPDCIKCFILTSSRTLRNRSRRAWATLYFSLRLAFLFVLYCLAVDPMLSYKKKASITYIYPQDAYQKWTLRSDIQVIKVIIGYNLDLGNQYQCSLHFVFIRAWQIFIHRSFLKLKQSNIIKKQCISYKGLQQ